jgi:hypothetical protein
MCKKRHGSRKDVRSRPWQQYSERKSLGQKWQWIQLGYVLRQQFQSPLQKSAEQEHAAAAMSESIIDPSITITIKSLISFFTMLPLSYISVHTSNNNNNKQYI